MTTKPTTETDIELIFDGDLILTEDFKTEKNLIVHGNISGKTGLRYDLNCRDLNCLNLSCLNLSCMDLNCWDLSCLNLSCLNLSCMDLNCWDLSCWNLNFYAVAIAYNSFKCKSWKARREKYIIKCLDREIEITGENKKICDKCKQEIEK